MKTRILVAKYIEDARRWEPVNVGVFVLRGDEAQARFLGERGAGGGVDRRRLRYRVGDTEAYGEWVAFWRRSLERPGEAVADAILSVARPNYWVADQGEVWFDGEAQPLDALADRYFDELVQPSEEADEPPQLKQRVDHVLAQARLFERGDLQTNVTVEADLDPPERYKFHYLLENGRKTVAHRVGLEPVWLHDALWKFDHLPRDLGKVAFVAAEEAAEELAPTLQHLRERARVIDVNSPAAVDDIIAAFTG